MIVTKPQKPIKPIQPIKAIELTKPKAPKKPVHHRKFGSEVSVPKPKPIPEFGTGGYVSALEDEDRRYGSKPNASTSSTSSLSAMNSGNWLNPSHPIPDYLGSDWMFESVVYSKNR
jgi:hypothetical protein